MSILLAINKEVDQKTNCTNNQSLISLQIIGNLFFILLLNFSFLLYGLFFGIAHYSFLCLHFWSISQKEPTNSKIAKHQSCAIFPTVYTILFSFLILGYFPSTSIPITFIFIRFSKFIH